MSVRDEAMPSLRRSMLRRLALPLSLLVLGSALLAFWLVWEYTGRVVDRALLDLANGVAVQVRLAGPSAGRVVPPLAQAMFTDPDEPLAYRIVSNGRELAGDTQLPLCTPKLRHCAAQVTFDAEYGGESVRIAQTRVRAGNGSDAIVAVSQTKRRRYQLAVEILAAIVTPLLLLLVSGWLIVWRVVTQQLSPLRRMADSLNRQTHTSLEPVDETGVPIEIRPLTGALNALLERLKKAVDAQRKFIADAAHQLRTPLTAIKLHADHALHGGDPARVQRALRELSDACDRAVRLSNQLLSLARAEPTEQTARFVALDVAALAFETGADWVPRALAAGLDLGFQDERENPSRPLRVRGSEVLLGEVLANLIDNAIKYVPPHRAADGHITVRIAVRMDTQGEEAQIAVEDNGPGVPEGRSEALFERFFRGDATHGNGSGLGLAIVRDIVALHGGRVYYEDGPGGGSRFVIRLPMLSEAA